LIPSINPRRVETKPSSLAIVKTPIESVFVNGDAVRSAFVVSFETSNLSVGKRNHELFFLHYAVRRK
jgi:hypothetical protein